MTLPFYAAVMVALAVVYSMSVSVGTMTCLTVWIGLVWKYGRDTIPIHGDAALALARRAYFWVRLLGVGFLCAVRVSFRLSGKLIWLLWSESRLPTITTLRVQTRRLLSQPETQQELGEAFCTWCHAAGVAFVKFAQLISGRDKEFAPAFLHPLKSLQSHVPAHMDWSVVQPLLPTHESLMSIKSDAFACGCGAQVHEGVQRVVTAAAPTTPPHASPSSASSASSSSSPPITSRSWATQSPVDAFQGRRVALKVKSVYLEQTIQDSFAALIPFCRLLIWLRIFYCREDKLISMLNDVKESLVQQLDLPKEARNQTFLRRRFMREDHRTGSADNGTSRVYPIYVPRVIPELTNEHVLGMEFIPGVSMEEAAKRLSPDQRQRVTETMLHLFYNATFLDYYLDPDNHAGNFLISLGDVSRDEVRLIKLDCGLAYRLKPQDAQLLARFCLPFLEQNTEDLAAWFFDRIEFHPTPDCVSSAVRKASPGFRELIMHDLREVVGATLCCPNPSWLKCVTHITVLFDRHKCNMSSEVDHFLMALGHLETTAQLFIESNIAQWMVENSGKFRNENLRDFAYGEPIELDDEEEEEEEEEEKQ